MVSWSAIAPPVLSSALTALLLSSIKSPDTPSRVEQRHHVACRGRYRWALESAFWRRAMGSIRYASVQFPWRTTSLLPAILWTALARRCANAASSSFYVRMTPMFSYRHTRFTAMSSVDNADTMSTEISAYPWRDSPHGPTGGAAQNQRAYGSGCDSFLTAFVADGLAVPRDSD